MCDNEIIPGVPRRILRLSEYATVAKVGDPLLWEPTGMYGVYIARATDGPFSHASAAFPIDGILLQAGFEESRSGCLSLLRDEVRRHPGRIHAWRVTGFSDEHLADRRAAMLRLLEGDYSWSNIGVLFLSQLTLVRVLWLPRWLRGWVRRSVEHRFRSGKVHFSICSQYLAEVYHEAHGMYFVKKRFAEVTPNDISASASTEYLGELVPDDWEE